MKMRLLWSLAIAVVVISAGVWTMAGRSAEEGWGRSLRARRSAAGRCAAGRRPAVNRLDAAVQLFPFTPGRTRRRALVLGSMTLNQTADRLFGLPL